MLPIGSILKKGFWITSSFYTDSLPRWVNDFNSKALHDTYTNRLWQPLLPIESYTESLPDNSEYEHGFNGQHTFPYDLENLKKKAKNKVQYEILAQTPFGDSYTKDFAISAIVNEGLGQNENPDYLSVFFSSTEAIGRMFGPSSVEMQDAFLRLDKEIAHFLTFVDGAVGLNNTLIFLTSASGIAHVPDYLKDIYRIPVGYFVPGASMALLKSYLNVHYGEGDWVKFYHQGQVFLNRELIEDSNLELHSVQNKVANFLLQFEGVANTVTSYALQNNTFNGGLLGKVQNSFHPKYSGDVIINLKPGWVEKTDDQVTGHNSSYRYDSHVPLIWYGWKIKRLKINRAIDLTDIAPTICSFMNISAPGASTGEIIVELME
ncbi:MAG: hypothetical protein HC896_01990 [Bacteroidales bacterium]|nr:hypothetical protein [Bacteroidales bacterium]